MGQPTIAKKKENGDYLRQTELDTKLLSLIVPRAINLPMRTSRGLTMLSL